MSGNWNWYLGKAGVPTSMFRVGDICARAATDRHWAAGCKSSILGHWAGFASAYDCFSGFLSFTCRLAPPTSCCWLTASFLGVLSLDGTALWLSTLITSTLRSQGVLVFFHCSQSLRQKINRGRLIPAQTTSLACLSCCPC